MLSGISVVCFAASYAVAFVLELTRQLFRSAIRGAVMIGFASAGLLAHTLFLAHRAATAAGSPLSSEQDWYFLAAWALAATYLYLTLYHPQTAFGVFVLPLVLGLIAVATFLANPRPFAREPASQAWGMIHGASIMLATVTVLIGFVAGLMYFQQASRLKRKLPPKRGFRLPSLEWLQKTNSRAIVISAVLLGVGVLSGIVLNLINHAGRIPWHDPTVVSTWLMFIWLAIAATISHLYKPASVGRKVAYLTIASFIVLLVALGVGLLGNSEHGRTQHRSDSRQRPHAARPCGVRWAKVASPGRPELIHGGRALSVPPANQGGPA